MVRVPSPEPCRWTDLSGWDVGTSSEVIEQLLEDEEVEHIR